MWFVFILAPAALAAVGALFSLTGGAHFMVIASVFSEWQRRRGHREGEGQFTHRVDHTYYGVQVNEHTDLDISQDLGVLAHYLPKKFSPFLSKRFDFTESEGRLLRTMLIPATNALSTMLDLMEQRTIRQEDPDLHELILAASDALNNAVNPIVLLLEQFPASRVKAV